MELKERPKIAIKKTRVEIVLDITTFMLFIIFTLYFTQQWMTLPNELPIHFNMKGEPDGWGGKWVVWIPLIIGLILWIGLSTLEKYPHTYNYLNLNLDNAERQYTNARIMVNVMKAEITLFFMYISWMILGFSSEKEANNGWLPIVIFIIVLFGSIAFFIYRSFKLK
ncbi:MULTISPECIES: DUF1648 domain-containing protein [Paenibacillus]|uniref:DUF1648 domain-containing protein n=1 Tax=Paenibacillus TaxID=44249 RepID=UPI002859B6F8|nr:DUF1648 domain-containing protein [Paenibacillus sp. 2003]MDR6716437.1 putative membrane protein [Paenibacillus sp. 2003]